MAYMIRMQGSLSVLMKIISYKSDQLVKNHDYDDILDLGKSIYVRVMTHLRTHMYSIPFK